MPVFLLKSLLSLGTAVLTLFAMYTMFEFMGRQQPRHEPETLRRLHRANGILYVLLFVLIAYMCFRYLRASRVEPSSRAVVHFVLAVVIILLLGIKVLFVRVYRTFYPYVKPIGLVMAVSSLTMVVLSGGYYLTVGGLPAAKKAMVETEEKDTAAPVLGLSTDASSISRGGDLYDEKCSFCHDPDSNQTLIGPGHKGILKNPALPVSGRPATPGNIARQLRDPYQSMPSFDYLSDAQVSDIISFMNTL